MRNEIIVITSVSGLLFCFIMVFSSLSPMPYGDAFNSVGMWSNIGFMLFFYIFSLFLYIAGADWMKYVMAVFCGLGLLISLSISMVTLVAIAWIGSVSGFIILFLLSVVAMLVNIAWFIVAFRKKHTASA